MLRRPVIALAAALACALPASGQSAKLRFVDGRPVLHVKLRAGEVQYECHLLVDLARRDALFLHANAARSLGALSCDVVAGELVLAELSFDASRDRWLEAFTARNATGLKEVPLAGYLGLAAFRDHTLTIDGPSERFELRSAAAGFERPPESPERAVADLVGTPSRDGLRARVDLAADRTALLALNTREAASLMSPRLFRDSGGTGRLAAARVGALDLAALTPFHPGDPGRGVDLTLGGAALARLRTTIQTDQGWIAFERLDDTFPEDEAAFVAARYGSDPIPALATFLEQFPDSAFRDDAAQARLELLANSGAGPEPVVEAALARITAAAKDARARTALQILDALPTEPSWSEARRAIAAAGLEHERVDEDGTAGPKLHLEIGRIARRDGHGDEAYRHLLAAIFGLPGDGPANLELGGLFEDRGELERAESRFLLAMLDMEDTGEDGLLALKRVFTKRHGSSDGLQPALAEMAEGRVPALHPIPREPEEVAPTGRVVLVELFTGAMCPPCAAADVAADALDAYYRPDEIALIQWHLPIPAPEPMVSAIAQERARRFGIRGTPTAVFGGREQIVGGGRAEQAPDMFAKYRDTLTPLLSAQPSATIDATARLESGAVQLRASAALNNGVSASPRLHAVLVERTLVFPGRNGILFHHHVARAGLTPPRGIALTDCTAAAPFETRLGLDRVEAILDQVVAQFETERFFQIRPVRPDPAQLLVVLFLEDPDSGTVLQALTVDVAQ
ncbi:MAG: hypothetical protein IPM29_06565 [Planctomycetes bacterium]|nr:hypothetical protein [Planctomycetota bacterium]